MSSTLLEAAYSPQNFRQNAHQLIDKLADHLERSLSGTSSKVINWSSPEEEREFWKDFLNSSKEPQQLFDAIIERSIHIHHPKYIGHQISPTVPITILTSMLNAQLNNGMGVYEMGAASTAMERIVTDLLCSQLGYSDKANGFLTSGGTLANLTALLSARKAVLEQDVWQAGYSGKLAVMVSQDAHYCIDRAARIMSLGEQGIVKIPVDNNFMLRSELLESCFEKAKNDGLTVFAIVASAPSTATGIYDNLEAIAEFAAKKKIWMHVDAAHGGAAIFSAKYKSLLKGVHQADSVAIDGHKMMMMPSITTALLFKEGSNSHRTFMQQADYLLHETEDEDWYNLAKRTFECTKYMMSLHWYALIKTYGFSLFDEFVTTLYDLGNKFAAIIREDPDFELAVLPMSNIVCFRYTGNLIKNNELNKINLSLRKLLLEDGEYYIVQTVLRGQNYLRMTIMNPFTSTAMLEALLIKLKHLAKSLTADRS